MRALVPFAAPAGATRRRVSCQARLAPTTPIWLLPPLHRAARLGNISTLRRLLQAPDAAVDARDAIGSTALMHAAEKQRVAAVRVLLESGADAALQNDWLWSAALYSTLGRKADELRPLLLAAGAPERAGVTLPRTLLGAHGRLLHQSDAARAPSEQVFGWRGLLDSAVQSATDIAGRPSDIRPGGVAIAGATCARLGLYAGQRYEVRALFWRPAGLFTEDERRIPAASLEASPPAEGYELCAELAAPRWMPWGSTEVGVDAARLRSVAAELGGALAFSVSFAAAVLVALPALTVVTFAYVPSDSMAPTLLRGDAVVALLRPAQILPGDIVLFQPPPALRALVASVPNAPPLRDGDLFIKRAVGVEGDQMSVANGVLTRNGVAEAQPPGACDVCRPARYDWTLTVGAGQLAVLGDNRGGSTDSHAWGALDRRSVVGRVVWRWWPLQRFGAVS